MIEGADAALACGGSLAGIVAAILYVCYRNRNKAAYDLKKVELVKMGVELKHKLQAMDNHCLSYAAVQGVVTHQGKTFKSVRSDTEGVILHTSLMEHKSKRTQGVWNDVKKVLMENLENAPFSLTDPDNPGHAVSVTDATSAMYLLDELEVTHHEFVPKETSTWQSGLDRLFGEVCRGYEKTEKMLAVGTSLMGVGEIFLEDGKLKLRPPQTPGLNYYLTTMTKSQMLKVFRSQATTLRVISVIFGVIATGMISLAVWRITQRYIEFKNSQRDLEEIRRVTLQRYAEAREISNEASEDETCVICLNNPREVVTLNCGHIAMCTDCAQMLPQHSCPVCREPIERFLPIYRP